MVKKIRYFPQMEYGKWKDGSEILKDEKGLYVVKKNVKKNIEIKKYIKVFKEGNKKTKKVLRKLDKKYKKTVKNKK
jgi:hypothetical protein